MLKIRTGMVAAKNNGEVMLHQPFLKILSPGDLSRGKKLWIMFFLKIRNPVQLGFDVVKIESIRSGKQNVDGSIYTPHDEMLPSEVNGNLVYDLINKRIVIL